jgi:hypothetical protein
MAGADNLLLLPGAQTRVKLGLAGAGMVGTWPAVLRKMRIVWRLHCKVRRSSGLVCMGVDIYLFRERFVAARKNAVCVWIYFPSVGWTDAVDQL